MFAKDQLVFIEHGATGLRLGQVVMVLPDQIEVHEIGSALNLETLMFDGHGHRPHALSIFPVTGRDADLARLIDQTFPTLGSQEQQLLAMESEQGEERSESWYLHRRKVARLSTDLHLLRLAKQRILERQARSGKE